MTGYELLWTLLAMEDYQLRGEVHLVDGDRWTGPLVDIGTAGGNQDGVVIELSNTP